MHRLLLAGAILLIAMLGPVSRASIVSAAHAEQKTPGFSALMEIKAGRQTMRRKT
jgi:hypothetical protein